MGRSSTEHGVGGQPHKTPHFNSRHQYTHPARMTLPSRAWVRLTRLRPVSDVSAVACTNGVWPPLRPVSVAQNKPSTILTSIVQSIDLCMDCTTGRFWMMRQPNGCSTLAPKSSAAKQWIKEELAQTKEEKEDKIEIWPLQNKLCWDHWQRSPQLSTQHQFRWTKTIAKWRRTVS